MSQCVTVGIGFANIDWSVTVNYEHLTRISGMSTSLISWGTNGIVMGFKIGIIHRLSLIFLLFFLIFCGTVSILLFNVQRMVETTENIVIKNNKINELSEDILASLLDMEANHKKLNILKKSKYSEYFEQAKFAFEEGLGHAVQLSSQTESKGKNWQDLEYSYQRHKVGVWDDSNSPHIGLHWVSESVVSNWIDIIKRAKSQNQQDIESALRELNERSRVSVRNGLFGFCISIVVGLIGVWLISRSIFLPLKTIVSGLQRISQDKFHLPIKLKGGEEFSKLATAYNDMSEQLYEEENTRTEFIATLSHEIRTPLASIHESVNMIVEEVFGPVNDKQRKFLKIASVEIKRINELLKHLLSVSVLEAGTRKKQSKKITTKELVLSSTEIFASFAEKKSVTLKVKGVKNCPGLYGVKEELQQVFINLIDNAIKYSPEHSSVTVSYTKDNAKNWLLFQVSDTGPGIPEEELSLIFTKYYRTKGVREHLDGVGLGLAISRKIVASYGGQINVENNQGRGCTFSFTLPTQR